MNKAFVREPDSTVEYCPRCGSLGEPVGQAVLATHLAPEDLNSLAATANFCPAPSCEVAYFDMFERVVLATALPKSVYPKDPDAPLCACFGLTRDDVEQDLAEGGVTRVRRIIELAGTEAARCSELAADGQKCIARVQKYFLQRRGQVSS